MRTIILALVLTAIGIGAATAAHATSHPTEPKMGRDAGIGRRPKSRAETNYDCLNCKLVMAGLVPAIHVFEHVLVAIRGCPAQGRA